MAISHAWDLDGNVYRATMEELEQLSMNCPVFVAATGDVSSGLDGIPPIDEHRHGQLVLYNSCHGRVAQIGVYCRVNGGIWSHVKAGSKVECFPGDVLRFAYWDGYKEGEVTTWKPVKMRIAYSLHGSDTAKHVKCSSLTCHTGKYASEFLAADAIIDVVPDNGSYMGPSAWETMSTEFSVKVNLDGKSVLGHHDPLSSSEAFYAMQQRYTPDALKGYCGPRKDYVFESGKPRTVFVDHSATRAMREACIADFAFFDALTEFEDTPEVRIAFDPAFLDRVVDEGLGESLVIALAVLFDTWNVRHLVVRSISCRHLVFLMAFQMETLHLSFESVAPSTVYDIPRLCCCHIRSLQVGNLDRSDGLLSLAELCRFTLDELDVIDNTLSIMIQLPECPRLQTLTLIGCSPVHPIRMPKLRHLRYLLHTRNELLPLGWVFDFPAVEELDIMCAGTIPPTFGVDRSGRSNLSTLDPKRFGEREYACRVIIGPHFFQCPLNPQGSYTGRTNGISRLAAAFDPEVWDVMPRDERLRLTEIVNGVDEQFSNRLIEMFARAATIRLADGSSPMKLVRVEAPRRNEEIALRVRACFPRTDAAVVPQWRYEDGSPLGLCVETDE